MIGENFASQDRKNVRNNAVNFQNVLMPSMWVITLLPFTTKTGSCLQRHLPK